MKELKLKITDIVVWEGTRKLEFNLSDDVDVTELNDIFEYYDKDLIVILEKVN